MENVRTKTIKKKMVNVYKSKRILILCSLKLIELLRLKTQIE